MFAGIHCSSLPQSR